MLTDVKLTKGQKEDLKKIIVSFVILIVASFINANIYITTALFFISYLVVGYEVLKEAGYNIIHGQVFDETFLMSIATIGALALGEYSEAVFVMVFYSVGELFESIAVDRSRNAIKSLLEYAPDEARVIRDGKEEIVDPSDIKIGETIIVYAGEKIPLDGTIVEGNSTLNLAFLTGESAPVEVKEGETVPSGAINNSGVIKIKTEKTFDDSTVSKILELIEESTDKKSVLESFITRFSRYYTPTVVFAAIIIAVVPPIVLNQAFSMWIQRALIFLVVSCPCALVISVPVSFFGGIGKASRNGILVKGSNFLESMSMLETVVFDKTGTLTEGNFEIIEEVNLSEREDWKKYLGTLESFSTHPISLPIVKSYGKLDNVEIKDLEEIKGKGIVGKIDGKFVAAGNEKLMKQFEIDFSATNSAGSVIYVAVDGTHEGTVIIADKIKDEAKSALSHIKSQGVKNLVLLTGDKKDVGEDVAKKLGIDKVYSELLPGEKVEKLEEILNEKSKKKTVAFVGDGINDAPVIMRADIGIAMGSLGSDAAIEAADIVLMDDNLEKIAETVEISKKTSNIAKQNVTLAIGVKILVLLLATVGKATMWMAIFGDVGVLIIAVLNSMRALK